MTMDMKESTQRLPRAVFVVGFVAALAGLLFGMDIGVISGVLPLLEKEWGTTSGQAEMIVSMLLVGACIGSLLSGVLSRKYGRKFMLLISALVFAAGSLGTVFAQDVLTLEILRFFLGLAVGVASFTAPLYLSEISPERVRGAMISMYQLMITIGILMAFLSDTLLSYGAHWRWMMGLIAIPSCIMFLGILTLPNSPRWLMLVNRHKEARKVLSKFNPNPEGVLRDIARIRGSLEQSDSGSVRQLLKNPHFRRVAVLGMALQMFQQFTGINVVMYYAPKIFQEAGFASSSQRMWGTVAIGVVNVLATFIAIGFCDRFGRKPILYIGCTVMTVAMGGLATIFGVGVHSTAILPYVCAGFLLLFIVGFACSAGPLVWVLCSEIYPLAGRDLGITLSTATNWFCNAIIGATFLTLLTDVGSSATFALFAVMNILFCLTVWRFCPETRGVSLEGIESNLMAGEKLRNIGIDESISMPIRTS